jgi:hypothetical protein
MPKGFVIIAIIVMEEVRSLGIVNMMFFMLQACVKTAT